MTVDGNISGYEVHGKEELDPLSITADVNSTLAGLLTLYITIFNDGSARATVTGSFGARLKFSGQRQTLQRANIYEGMTIY